MKKNQLTVLLYIVFVFLPILSALNCSGWWIGAGRPSCLIDIFGISSFFATLIPTLIFFSIFTFWAPLFLYIFGFKALTKSVEKEKRPNRSSTGFIIPLFIGVGALFIPFYVIAFISGLVKWKMSFGFLWVILFYTIICGYYISLVRKEKKNQALQGIDTELETKAEPLDKILIFLIVGGTFYLSAIINELKRGQLPPLLFWSFVLYLLVACYYIFIVRKKRENQTPQEAPKETKKVNQKIASVDIGGTKFAVFSFLGGKVIKVNSVDLIKVAKVVIAQANKNTFAPGELREIYAKIHDNYESQLDPETFKKLADLLKQFVEEGGEISFE